jgi:hypothetical protein
MVEVADRIDGWWRVRKLPPVIMKNTGLGYRASLGFHRERNGASPNPRALTPSFALDIAVVVIDRMARRRGKGAGGLGLAQDDGEFESQARAV